jgi:CheY-like chemotaxis protein
MASKRALVVDDSKSARLILRKMLEKHAIEVDTAESAEDALDYLLHQQPHVIFMDHMMPGMDGFEAVKLIKGDPRTATIPIMMYTSREGEVYVGEARALGAVGVLPKTVKPADLVKVLETLHLLPAGEAIEPVQERPPRSRPAPMPAPEAVPAGAITALAREAAEDAIGQFMRTQFRELRQQVREDMQVELKATVEELLAAAPADPAPARHRRRVPLYAALAALISAPLIYALLPSAPAPITPVQPAAATASAAYDDQAEYLRTLAVQRVRAGQEKARLLETVAWALNQAGQYEFGQLAFGDERLATVSDLLARLSAVGFEGTVRLEAHLGKFCLSRDANGELRLAPPELSLLRCDSLGFDRELALALGERQSVAFANFLGSSPLVGGKIRLELVSRGEDLPRYPYPSTASVAKAGQWNALALRNQRVEISLLPAP